MFSYHVSHFSAANVVVAAGARVKDAIIMEGTTIDVCHQLTSVMHSDT